MIQESYCSTEVYRLLKEKGFDGVFHTSYDKDGYTMVSVTHQTATAWLREKGIHISPKYCCFQGPKKSDKPYYKWEDRVIKLSSGEQIHPDVLGIHEHYSSYEEAIEAALKVSLEKLI